MAQALGLKRSGPRKDGTDKKPLWDLCDGRKLSVIEKANPRVLPVSGMGRMKGGTSTMTQNSGGRTDGSSGDSCVELTCAGSRAPPGHGVPWPPASYSTGRSAALGPGSALAAARGGPSAPSNQRWPLGLRGDNKHPDFERLGCFFSWHGARQILG